jgi:hypothetical protein
MPMAGNGLQGAERMPRLITEFLIPSNKANALMKMGNT